MAAEITQLLCDLWELPTSEQETSGHLSKWKGQLADLKDQWYPTGGDIPVKHLHLPAKPGPLWSTNGTKWALPKPSPNIFTRIIFFAGWFLSSHKATLCPASVLVLLPTNVFSHKKEGCTPSQSLPGIWKELHSTKCAFLFQSNKVVWFPGIYLPGKKGVKRFLALLPSPWAAAAHGSASPPAGLLAVLWLLPLWTGVTFSPDCGQKRKKIDGTRYARYQAHDCWQISKYFCGLCWKHIPGDTVRVYKVFWGEHCSMEKQRRNLTKATLQKAKK